MSYRFGLLPITRLVATLLVAALLAPTASRASEDPVATATIPPAPATAAAAEKPFWVSPTSSAPAKKQVQIPTTHKKPDLAQAALAKAQLAKVAQAKRAALHKQVHQVKREHRQLYARAYPPPPIHPQYYAGPPEPGPEGDGPSMPPPGWYGRGPPVGYPYPGPRRMGLW